MVSFSIQHFLKQGVRGAASKAPRPLRCSGFASVRANCACSAPTGRTGMA